MNEQPILELRFNGKNISPELIRAKELASILQALDELLAAETAHIYPHLPAENAAVGLVSIQSGSLALSFQTKTPEIKTVFHHVASTIEQMKFDRLTTRGLESLRTIASFGKRYDCRTEFRSTDKPTALAVLEPNTEIQPLPILDGETTLYGEIIRVGGKEPKVTLELTSGQTISCDASEALTKDLATRLYTWVGLKGMATWNAHDNRLITFNIQKITSYENLSYSQAFDLLSDMIGKHLDHINDVAQYVADLRSE